MPERLPIDADGGQGRRYPRVGVPWALSLDASPLGWLHLARPRENWHRLDAAAREWLRGEFARIREQTAEDGAAVFGPYATAGYDEWDRFVNAEFSDLATLFRLEARLQRIDYMSYVDFANHLGRKYAGPLRAERAGQQPFCVVGFASHDDAWYGRPRDERERIERDELGPAAAPLAAAGVSFLALNICDVTAGPRQFFLWEAPSLAVAQAVRAHWATFWRYHRGARMIVGERVGR